VHGGWQATKWLNSYSTHLKLVTGGHYGRALQKDEIINFAANNFSFTENRILPWGISSKELYKMYQPPDKIRCIKSIEWDLLDAASKQNFEKNNCTVNNQSDRMGYRLKCQPLLMQQPTELISSAVDAGIIQLLPDGNCIVLMADHQTTGGYPRIAAVIKTDLPKLAQTKPGQSINFTIVSLQHAEEALIKMQQTWQEIKAACYLNFKKIL
jgi:antagonist of KipI